MKTPRHFGSIRKLPSGRYQASYLGEDGQRVNAPMTFPTKKPAQEWLTGIENDRIQGITRKAPKKTLTLGVFSEDWLTNRQNLRPSSRDQYRRNLDRFILPKLGSLKLVDFDLPLVRKWYAEIGRELANSKRVIAAGTNGTAMQADAYRLLRAIFGTAVEDELIEVNPCRIKNGSRPEKQRDDEQVLTPAEIALLAHHINPRYRALVYLSAYGTLRIGELIALRRADVDLSAGTVTVRENMVWVAGTWVRGKPKSKAGKRTVYLPATVVEELRVHLAKFVGESPASPVFTTHKGTIPSRQTVRSAMINAGKKFGRPDLFPHLLRHTALTMTSQVGATPKEVMARGGHSDVKVAMIYQHSVVERERELASKLDELARSAA